MLQLFRKTFFFRSVFVLYQTSLVVSDRIERLGIGTSLCFFARACSSSTVIFGAYYLISIVSEAAWDNDLRALIVVWRLAGALELSIQSSNSGSVDCSLSNNSIVPLTITPSLVGALWSGARLLSAVITSISVSRYDTFDKIWCMGVTDLSV